MILFFNVFITDQRRGGYHRGHLGPHDPYQVFKYTLASMAVLPDVTEAIFHVRLDEPYQQYWGDLCNSTWDLFGPKARIHNWRNEHQRQWQAAVEQLPEDELIWYMCNHDHPFIDYGLDSYLELQDTMRGDGDPRVAGYISHFPEAARWSQKFRDWNIRGNGVINTVHHRMDSIQIVSKPLLHQWWHTGDYGDKYVPRSDWDGIWECPQYPCYIPKREMVCHFDGYSHIMDITHTPPLDIPPGFFEGDIKVRFGYPDRQEGWVNLNPMAASYRIHDPEGVDYKCVPDDLPLFWRSRITHLDVAPDLDPDAVMAARNLARLEYMWAPCSHPDMGIHMPDLNWIEQYSFRCP
jgi:hypothetical protein